MDSDLSYSAVVISGKVTVAIRELSMTADERILELEVDSTPRGQIFLRPWCMPRLAFGGRELIVWGGLRAYVLALSDNSIHRFDMEDEIHGAYDLSIYWCLICETSVVLWNSREGVRLAECHHNEILLKSWWQNDHLIVEDLQNRWYEIEIDEGGFQIALHRREPEASTIR